MPEIGLDKGEGASGGRWMPLQGIRILDFGWVWAGPVVGQILGDMGGEVIKVESRRRLDFVRLFPPFAGGKPDPDGGLFFHSLNRNKLSLTLDLTQAKAVELLKRLVKLCDVVVENFSPKALPKLGLDYPALREVKPDLIMVSLSAAGQTGPWRDVLTYGPSLGALAGLDSLIGYPGERVLGWPMAYTDPASGLLAVFGIMAALLHRKRTGQGQYIDLAQWEATTALLPEFIMDFTMNGRIAGPQGNRHRRMAPHGCFRCRGEDAWVSIAVESEEEWRNLARALGNPDWCREHRFSSPEGRREAEEELRRRIEEWTSQRTPQEVMELLQAYAVAAFASYGIGDLLSDSHFEERGAKVVVDHPHMKGEVLYGLPWKFSRTPGRIRRRAPLLGEHNRYVLCELLGMSEEEVRSLEAEKVVY
jgi:benzylsuccinate CoA-transferase BbsF subunit